MVVHQADRLHECVTDGRPDELEAAPHEVLRQGLRDPRPRRHLPDGMPAVADRMPADEAPQVRVEGSELLLHGEERPGALHRALDLGAVANDPLVAEQPADGGGAEARNPAGIEPGERLAISVALAQDRQPGEPGLCALEYEELEQLPVV